MIVNNRVVVARQIK